MANIDVSELMTDPDFVDDVILVHRKTEVDSFGQNSLSQTSVKTIGSVQPASGKTLQRLPEALRVDNVSSFWIKGTIVSDGGCAYPDVICFKGSRYNVQTIMDWTNWGEGWCEGTCVREKPTLG